MKRVAERLLIAGVGLIGGSLAMALRARGAVGEVVGFGRSAENLRIARRRGIIDRAERDPARAARGADLVVVAVPVQAIAPVLGTLAAGLPPTAVITDAGSVKGPVVAAAERVLGQSAGRFCGSHPIAGTEHSGAAAALVDLLEGQRCILTPGALTTSPTRRRVHALWEAAGMRVEEMPARAHDRVFALVSHLPHVAAYALVNAVADADRAGARRALAYAAGGFKDWTRIAASSPEMWRDICLANRDEVLAAIDGFGAAVERLRIAVAQGDGTALMAELTRAHTTRRRLGTATATKPPRLRARRGARRTRGR
ncbi:MAG TPA: prephenate dehydrogenase/arogenate dehydrogenase family protein [Candidatus Binatia bacterium]